MSAITETISVPLRQGPDGVLRVGSTRIPLERVVHAFEDGATPEEIVGNYDTLKLADVYAVIAYYLGHRDEVNEYLRHREDAAAEVRRMIEARQPDMASIRARLLARLDRKEPPDASTGQ